MKKDLINSLVLILILGVGISACSKHKGYDKTADGLYYKIITASKDTVKPKTGEWITVSMVWQYKDSVMFDSRKSQGGAPIRFRLPPSDFKGDLYSGIRMMSVGDSASFLVNADSLFRKTFKQPERPKFIDTNSVINFYIKLVAAENPQVLMKKEQEMLEKYLKEKNITAPPTPAGFYFLESIAGKGIKIDTGTWISVHFIVSLLDGKKLFSSYERGEPIKFQYGKRFDTPGVEQAIGMMKKGGKATVIVPSGLAFGENGRGALVPPYSTIVYEVEIINLQSNAEYEKANAAARKKEAVEAQKLKEKNAKAQKEESILLDKYLKEHKITVSPTTSGLYYIEKVKGKGTKAAAGKTVNVHYTGTLLNGKEFDSSKGKSPLEFIMGQGRVIQGWEEGIAMMNAGGKATLIIPSKIAYGESTMGSIPPFSTLVFDIELVSVKDAPAPKK